MSWFWRGFQSAVFYYLSCTPCNQLASRRRRRKGAARSKAEKEMDQGPYPHPSPFSTNMYWAEEMTLGPGPPQKRERQQKKKRRRDGTFKAAADDRDLVTGSSAETTGTSSADTVVQGVTELEQERRGSGDDWNRRRYQREDELLWGIDTISEDDDEALRVGDSYYTARNPAVNDLHPPVVSTAPRNKIETQWMLQPPPSAKIMEGKVRANRSRSDSGGSNGSSRRGEVGLGRQLGERLVEEKKRRRKRTGEEGGGEAGSAVLSRATSKESEVASTTGEGGQRHDRDEPSTEPPISATTQPPPPSSPQNLLLHPAAARPHLTTIPSSTFISPKLTPTPSLRALQELTSTNSTARPLSPAAPLHEPMEKEDFVEVPSVEMLWPPPPSPPFEFGGVRAEVRGKGRWSMDI
ncbi:MAG: hypothetical protein Q9222_005697 [Ikaeria aurantiellina]